MPDTWHERMATISNYQEDSSAEGRLSAWVYGYEKALEKPMLGGGYEAFLGHGRSAHSIYFQVLGEHGFVGFAFYILFLGSTFLLAGSVVRRAADHPDLVWAKDLMRMVQASLIVFGCVGAFLSLAYFELIVHLGAIAVVVDGMIRVMVRSSAPATARASETYEATGPAVDRGPAG
jgi:probable O-glycosylation ligase (exosortase A-associated)